jgi:primosomal protein N' (replication factor Y)
VLLFSGRSRFWQLLIRQSALFFSLSDINDLMYKEGNPAGIKALLAEASEPLRAHPAISQRPVKRTQPERLRVGRINNVSHPIVPLALMETWFCDVLLPVPVDRLFTYRVPGELNDRIRKGQRVIVPFGAKKVLTGVVAQLHQRPPAGYEAKPVLDVLDEHEVLYPQQFDLYLWMAAYYLCTPGEVLHVALPGGLKLSSESRIQLHPGFDTSHPAFAFSEKEWMLIEKLQGGSLTYTEASRVLGGKSILPLLKALASKNAILLFEEIREKYKPKIEKHIRLAAAYAQRNRLEALFAELARKPRQEEVLLKFLQRVPVLHDERANVRGMRKADLLSEAISDSSLQTLVKNQVLEEFEVIVPRFRWNNATEAAPLLLSKKQEEARNEILRTFETLPAVLLQGVTGSGKTEIYIDLIKRALDADTQVLYLLPEIALTTQLVGRLQKAVGAHMGVYHSRYSSNERVEVWNGVLQGKIRFVMGTRSAVFLPFDNLGLIIVDEEHDPSYKQQEPAPRYHARDVALWMAQSHHAKVLLGSATPSLESLYWVKQGRFGHVLLSERFGDSQLPAVALINLKAERQAKRMKGELSATLLAAMEETLAQNRQVIIFQNRRGHSPLVQCQECSWVPKCINCAVSLTFHQHSHALLCHYCGYREAQATQCPTCGSAHLLTLGYGTEKLEEELKLHLPQAVIQRMDADTTRARTSFEELIDAFAAGRTHVLVGTQMVTKGLDFDNVGLVGIFDADRMLHFPDFRSHERAFQLMLQVSGRAGRRQKQGRVLIQTYQPKHPVFEWIQTNNFSAFAESELADREKHRYPPFTRLVKITFKHMDKQVAKSFADEYSRLVQKAIPGVQWVGPGQPPVGRIRNEFLFSLLVKIPRNTGRLAEIKAELARTARALQLEKKGQRAKVVFDVDPA